jgi:hypothetical protein
MIDDEFLQKLHHVLLEVGIWLFALMLDENRLDLSNPPDTRRRRLDVMSELQSCLPHLERDSQHGAFLSILASIHTSLMPLFWIGLASCRTRNRLTSTAHSTKKGAVP